MPSTDDAGFGGNTDAHPSYSIILARTDHGLGGTLAYSHSHTYLPLCIYSLSGQQRRRGAAAPLTSSPFSVKRDLGSQLMTDG
ncbi:hypothetical protein CORC01_05910 [Colletotrichum orchidophilum]|uniref:Uncharacterized protein n=1 Tax=Colletotrichum orchidophilum TaxID=1209926 RepID=A0A1G4BBR7_9PEZI|nr:uncharacterized protein CORC01_05910 [Colletotrichum orchidophilum]OHE98821.1 hypothetical protein CORC01_05910 [Colletotrichum orchidophilum]